MKIVFMGTPDFAEESLKAIYEAGHNIELVVTNPDRPKGRGMKLVASPVKEYALTKGLPIEQPDKVKNNTEIIEKIEKGFEKVNKIYIADGHHRCASAAKVCLKRRAQDINYDENAEYNYFLSVLFPESELEILDYNRVIRDLNGLSEEEFLEKLKLNFDIEEKDAMYSPENKGEFGMYLKNKWYSLKFKHMDKVKDNLISGLDVSILQDYCFEPILGIENPRTNFNIDFSGGIRGLQELERRVHTDCKVAFSLKPTSMEELFRVAEAGLLMPPKSTWFEPKLRSGLFIHQL